MEQHVLQAGWQVKARTAGVELSEDFQSEDGWLPASVPGSVHEALWAAGQIQSPYNAQAQAHMAWIGERDFLYRCRFDAPPGCLPGADGRAVRLCFEGLDTVATVWLNGQALALGESDARADNMFLPREVDLGEAPLRPQSNVLWILFESALRVGQERQAWHGPRPVWNGDASRVYVRKAQYQYGWDFGPGMLGAGPWRPIRLLAFTARLSEVAIDVQPAEDLQRAAVQVQARIDNAAALLGLSLLLELHGPDGALLAQQTIVVPTGATEVSQALHIDQPALWWPRGSGAQPLYRVTLRLSQGRELLDEKTRRVGVRTIRLVEEPITGGTSFYFTVNGRPIFCGGANWIPADLFPSRVTPARYRSLLEQAAAANMTMLRVWGGGIYEDDLFYDLCDELGLLVYQDFMFACGLYPAMDWFATSVEAEAAHAVRRLRHHACIAIWAGNNEDYSIAQSVGAYRDPRAPIPEPATELSEAPAPVFDGRHIYERVLAGAARAHDPGRPYWPGSPYSRRDGDPNGQSEGDRHVWDVWHGQMRDYQDYASLSGRFASEFGMQGVPDRHTLALALGDARAIDDKALERLNKAEGGPQRIQRYLDKNLKAPGSIDAYIYATQLVQAEAMAYAVRGFRRRFGGPGDVAVGGALVWQLNDCWPGISWSLIGFSHTADYAIRRKPSYYAVKRELAPLALGLAVAGGSGPKVVEAWAVTLLAEELDAELRVRAFSLDGVLVGQRSWAVQLQRHQATELGVVALDALGGGSEPVVYGAELAKDGQVLARATLWPQPLKSLPLADPELAIEVAGDRVRVRARRPAKGVLLSAAAGPSTELEPEIDWSDNLFDLLPDETIELVGRGLGGRAVQARSLHGVLG